MVTMMNAQKPTKNKTISHEVHEIKNNQLMIIEVLKVKFNITDEEMDTYKAKLPKENVVIRRPPGRAPAAPPALPAGCMRARYTGDCMHACGRS